MKIIEVTGCPCVGKSTFLEKIGNEKSFCFSDYSIYGNPYALRVNKFSFFIRFLFFLMGVFCSKKMFFFVFSKICLNEKRFKQRCRVFFNVFLKIGRAKWILKKENDEVIIIDEGVSHIPFNLLLNEVDIEAFLKILPCFFSDIAVLHIKESKDVVKERILNRGHARVDGVSVELLERFLYKNFIVSEKVAFFYVDFFQSLLEVQSDDLFYSFNGFVRKVKRG